jgi:phosphoribosylformylglycinamidine cyclo-ligase
MYQVFNMGQRLEIFTDPKSAPAIIEQVRSFGIGAQIIGRAEASPKPELLIDTGTNKIGY